MSEPYLAGDTPVAEIVDPVEIGFLKSLGNNLNVLGADGVLHERFECRLFPVSFEFFVDIHEPLLFDLRFDNAAAATVHGDIVHIVFFGSDYEVFCAELLDNFFSRFDDIETAKLFSGTIKELPVVADDLFFVEVMSLGDVEVGRIVPGGNGHGTRPKAHIDRLVFDHSRRDRAIDPLNIFYFLTIGVLFVPIVVGMDNDILIAEFGFGAGGADHKGTVLKVIKVGFFFATLHFVVGDGGLKFRIPVDDARTAVNDAVIVHFFECGVDGVVANVIQGVRFATPVKRSAHFFALIDNGVM